MAKKSLTMVQMLVLFFVTQPSMAQEKLSPLDDPAMQQVEAFQVFDNLYYVGAKWVSCWVLKTSEGLILLDSLYGDLVTFPIEGIRQFDMDPADIKYVLVTHAHFDHIGGAKLLQQRFGASVGMVAEDWDIAAGEPLYRAYPKPERQLVIADGDSLTLGDTTIKFYKTPGHTTGVLSMKFDVWDQGKRHTAFTFGGVGLNFSGVDRTEMYIESVKRLMTMDDIEVNIPNHERSGEVFKRRELLRSRNPGEAHPFVDPQGHKRWLNELLLAAERKLQDEKAALR